VTADRGRDGQALLDESRLSWKPIPRARASLTPATARITLADLPGDVYESDLDAENDGTDPLTATRLNPPEPV
jgi:hypothetical protein